MIDCTLAFKVFVLLYLSMVVSFFNRDCIHAWILVVMTRLNLGLKSGIIKFCIPSKSIIYYHNYHYIHESFKIPLFPTTFFVNKDAYSYLFN